MFSYACGTYLILSCPKAKAWFLRCELQVLGAARIVPCRVGRCRVGLARRSLLSRLVRYISTQRIATRATAIMQTPTIMMKRRRLRMSLLMPLLAATVDKPLEWSCGLLVIILAWYSKYFARIFSKIFASVYYWPQNYKILTLILQSLFNEYYFVFQKLIYIKKIIVYKL